MITNHPTPDASKKALVGRTSRFLTRLLPIPRACDRLGDSTLDQGFHRRPKDRVPTQGDGGFCRANAYSHVPRFVEHESGTEVTRLRLDAKMSEAGLRLKPQGVDQRGGGLMAAETVASVAKVLKGHSGKTGVPSPVNLPTP